MVKKYGGLVLLVCMLIIFIVLLVRDYNEKAKEPNNIVTVNTETKSPEKSEEKSKTSILSGEKGINDKPLSGREYEEIIKGFYDAKNYAIKTGDNSYLNDCLEEGSNFKQKVLETIKKQNNVKFSMIVFKEVKEIKDNIHIILVEVYDKDEKREVIFKIKSRKSSSYVILDEK